jgi:hypothetical protein
MLLREPLCLVARLAVVGVVRLDWMLRVWSWLLGSTTEVGTLLARSVVITVWLLAGVGCA